MRPSEKVGLRSVPGQKFPPSLLLQGDKSLVEGDPVGARFAHCMHRKDGSMRVKFRELGVQNAFADKDRLRHQPLRGRGQYASAVVASRQTFRGTVQPQGSSRSS